MLLKSKFVNTNIEYINLWRNLYKNRFRIKNKIKKKAAFFSLKKKKILFIKVFQNSILVNEMLKPICYLRLHRKRRNVYFTYTNIHSTGSVIAKYSTGFYNKKSLRKTFFAINQLLIKSYLPLEYENKKKELVLWIKGYHNIRTQGFNKNIKNFLENTKYIINDFILYNSKPHNGMRKKKQRRK